MTGAELAALAEAQNVNPYFLAYALATGVQTVKEAWERDGNGVEFICWNNRRWVETCKRVGQAREFAGVFPGDRLAHLETLAAFVPAQRDDSKEPAPEPLWCCLCGQRHPFGTPCDQQRLDDLRRQAALVRRLAAQQRMKKGREQ